MSNMQKNFEKKSALRRIRMASGGAVQGPGGPREDKVPAMLSNGEYVLPAKTVQKLGGPEELDELVQQTNDGKAPKGAEERGERHTTLRKLAGGGFVGPLDPNDPRFGAAQSRAGTPTAAGMQSSVNMGEALQGPARPAGVPPVQPTTPPVQPAAVAEVAPKPGLMGRGLRAVGGVASSALGGAGNIIKGFAGPVAGAIGGITGAVQSYNDMDNGYRDHFDKSIDATPSMFGPVADSVTKDALRVMGNVGNAITLGYAGKLGQGVSSAMSGGSFSDGFSAPTDRDAFLAAKEPKSAAPQANGTDFGPPASLSNNPPQGRPTDAAPSPRSLAQSRFLSEQGVDAATQASAPVKLDITGTGANGVVTKNTGLRNVTEPGKFANLGSFLGPDNIYGTSTKPGGRINSFVGAGDPNRQETPQTIEAVKKLQSDLAADKLATAQKEEAQRQAQASQGNSGDINARFDAMASKVAGSYSAKGKGNENKRLLEIETQRNNALEADARSSASIRGQNQQLQIAQASNAVQSRGQDLQLQGHQATMGQAREFHNDTLRQNALQFAATQKQRDQAQEEQNVKDRTAAVDKLISRRFPDANKSGSPDGEKAIDYQNFIAKQDPKLVDAYTKGNATQRDEALSTIDRLYDTREKVNARGSSSLRGNTSLDTVLPVGNARNVEFGDYWGQGSLPWSNLPRRAAAVVGADAGKVQQMSNGQVVPLNDLTNDDSSVISNGKNASKVSALHQQRAMQAQLEAEARRKQLESLVKKQ